MRKFKDDRGRSYNDIFPELGRGDVNVAIIYPGTIKAFHRHQLQNDYWFIASGNVRAVLAQSLPLEGTTTSNVSGGFVNYTSSSSTVVTTNYTTTFSLNTPTEHYLSEGDLLFIPKGVWHGVQCLSNEPAIMIYHITKAYNEETPDEERAAWDAFHTWEFAKK